MQFKISIILLTIFCLLAGFNISLANDKIESDSLKSLAAFRTDSDIKIDGYLNESVWQQAPERPVSDRFIPPKANQRL